MSTHTKGPWEARGENGKYRRTNWDVVNDSLPYYATVPVHRGGYVVAMVVDADGDDDLLDANARLIAAAPELLEALIRLMGGVSDLQDALDAAKQAHAAIAKAKGEPHA